MDMVKPPILTKKGTKIRFILDNRNRIIRVIRGGGSLLKQGWVIKIKIFPENKFIKKNLDDSTIMTGNELAIPKSVASTSMTALVRSEKA